MLCEWSFFFLIENVANIFAKYDDVSVWNSWVCQRYKLISKCFNVKKKKLNGLTILYIEKDMLEHIDVDNY